MRYPLYRKDNPEDTGLGYLSVFTHEMAHTTVGIVRPDRIPGMIEQIMVYERDGDLQQTIRAENGLLLAALAAENEAARDRLITD